MQTLSERQIFVLKNPAKYCLPALRNPIPVNNKIFDVARNLSEAWPGMNVLQKIDYLYTLCPGLHA